MLPSRRSILKATLTGAFGWMIQSRSEAQTFFGQSERSVMPKLKEWRKPYPDFEIGHWQAKEYDAGRANLYPELRSGFAAFLDSLADKEWLPILGVGASYVPKDLAPPESRLTHGIYLEIHIVFNARSLTALNPRTNQPYGRYDSESPMIMRKDALKIYKRDTSCRLLFDHRKSRLIDSNDAYVPNERIWNVSVDQIGTAELYRAGFWGKDRPLVPTCGATALAGYAPQIEFLMHFDTGPTEPKDFVLELGEVEYLGHKIPIPAMIFKPYDMLRRVWLD